MTRALGVEITAMLRARGVDTVFGIPGVHNQELYRGMEAAEIRHVLARHEQGAGFMADGYARASGRPGVAFVITGPGLTNIMTPMGQAYSDSVPMLVISSALDDIETRHGQLHQMRDQVAAAGTVCDWSVEARTAEDAYALIDRALEEFHHSRARPKHIQVPMGLLSGAAPPFPEAPTPFANPELDCHAIAQAAAHIEAASRPLVILGGGSSGAAPEVRALLTRIQAASFASYAGRGVAEPGDPLHFGSMLARPGSADIAREADLLIVLGSTLSEVDLWRDRLGHVCPAIRVDIDADVLRQDLGHGTLGIKGDVGQVCVALLAAIDTPRDSQWSAARVAEQIALWRQEVSDERPGVAEVCEILLSAVPQGALFFSDMTQLAYGAKEIYPLGAPGLWHHPYGFGTLGFALPAAIGGKLARPEEPVIAIAGDYGFQYTVQELATAVELGLSLPILLWDNGKLGEIEDSIRRAQIRPNAVIARNPDFVSLARAYGAAAVDPADPVALSAAIGQALEHPGPTLIRVTPETVA
ncbi:MAG: thiamine pyrophosphate-binding protein [Pseudomonadota bacterium]